MTNSSFIKLRSTRDAAEVLGREIFNDRRPWKHVAADIGVSLKTLSKLAYGETKFPRLLTIQLIANYYGYEIGLIRMNKFGHNVR